MKFTSQIQYFLACLHLVSRIKSQESAWSILGTKSFFSTDRLFCSVPLCSPQVFIPLVSNCTNTTWLANKQLRTLLLSGSVLASEFMILCQVSCFICCLSRNPETSVLVQELLVRKLYFQESLFSRGLLVDLGSIFRQIPCPVGF